MALFNSNDDWNARVRKISTYQDSMATFMRPLLSNNSDDDDIIFEKLYALYIAYLYSTFDLDRFFVSHERFRLNYDKVVHVMRQMKTFDDVEQVQVTMHINSTAIRDSIFIASCCACFFLVKYFITRDNLHCIFDTASTLYCLKFHFCDRAYRAVTAMQHAKYVDIITTQHVDDECSAYFVRCIGTGEQRKHKMTTSGVIYRYDANKFRVDTANGILAKYLNFIWGV